MRVFLETVENERREGNMKTIGKIAAFSLAASASAFQSFKGGNV